MGASINDLERLLTLRRQAADAEEKAIIDKAIDKLIDNFHGGNSVISTPYPQSPWYVSELGKVPYLNNPIMCCVATKQEGK